MAAPWILYDSLGKTVSYPFCDSSDGWIFLLSQKTGALYRRTSVGRGLPRLIIMGERLSKISAAIAALAIGSGL